jgi:hypothetical protein
MEVDEMNAFELVMKYPWHTIGACLGAEILGIATVLIFFNGAFKKDRQQSAQQHPIICVSCGAVKLSASSFCDACRERIVGNDWQRVELFRRN